MSDKSEWFVKTGNGAVYGPAQISTLVKWAQEGRVEPTSLVSVDQVDWKIAPLLPELEMRWMVEVKPGDFFGPFNRKIVVKLFKEGSLSTESRVYRMYEFPPDMDPPPEKEIVEKVVEKEVRVEVPVEKIVEKVVEVPVDRVIEKVVEKEVRVEVPVEKIVEKVVEVPVDRVIEKVVEKEVRIEVPVEKIVEKIVEVPVEKIVERVIEVVPPAANEPVRAASQGAPSFKSFDGLDHDRLVALENAAHQELLRSRKFKVGGKLFGRKP